MLDMSESDGKRVSRATKKVTQPSTDTPQSRNEERLEDFYQRREEYYANNPIRLIRQKYGRIVNGKKRPLSQMKLAGDIHVVTLTIQNWEYGSVIPSEEGLLQLAAYLYPVPFEEPKLEDFETALPSNASEAEREQVHAEAISAFNIAHAAYLKKAAPYLREQEEQAKEIGRKWHEWYNNRPRAPRLDDVSGLGLDTVTE